jgi:hypothetical protein
VGVYESFVQLEPAAHSRPEISIKLVL